MPYSHLFDRVFSVESGIAAAVAAVVVGLTVFACLRYRARKGSEREPSHRHEWPMVEGLYTLSVLAVAGFLVWLSFTNMFKEQAADRLKPAVVVRVLAFQWCWQFTYEHHDATIQGTCNLGKDLPTLVLPAGEPVKFDIISNDVVHEFWLPYLDVKWAAFPNHVNHFTATFAKDGEWLGHCAEFCGLDHATMLFWVRVVPKATFTSWLSAHHGIHVQ